MMELQRLTPKQFERFQDFIYGCCGIKIDISKITLVSNRIRRRLNALKIVDFDSYYSFLTTKANDEELERFLEAITTNETYFFRTNTHFDWLKNHFVPEMLSLRSAGKHSNTLRFWSAACSSGDEAYSIAIAVLESNALIRQWNLEIVGTDISEKALTAARNGIYRETAMHEVKPPLREKYFSEIDGNWKVKPSLAKLAQFQNHNLMSPFVDSYFDCVFVRNVLIYFDQASKAKVIENLVRSLAPSGYLVVGPSEGIYDMLGMLEKRSSLIYQKPA